MLDQDTRSGASCRLRLFMPAHRRRRGLPSDETSAPRDRLAPLAPAVAAPLAVDRALDDRFAFIAGLATGSPSYAALEAEPAWRDYAKAADKAWAEFEAAVLEPMRPWAASDLALARERTETLFYPFGGPDLATAQALFPERRDRPPRPRAGRQPARARPVDARGPDGLLHDMAALVLDFLTRGYFITMDMTDIYSTARGRRRSAGHRLLPEEGRVRRGRRPAAGARGRRHLDGNPLCALSRAASPSLRHPDRLFQAGRIAPQDGLLFFLRRREPRLHGGLAPAPVPRRSRAPDDLHQGRLLPPPLGQLLDAAPAHPRPRASTSSRTTRPSRIASS